jgi:hypothetical protein
LLGKLLDLLSHTKEVAGTKFAPIVASVDAVMDSIGVPLSLTEDETPDDPLGTAATVLETTGDLAQGFVAVQTLLRVANGATWAAAALDVAATYPAIAAVATVSEVVGVGVAVVVGSFYLGTKVRESTNRAADQARTDVYQSFMNWFSRTASFSPY